MPCPDLNPCDDPCIDNPCYQDCGCLNPTTFECITKPGAHTSIGVTNLMNGVQVLEAINTAVSLLSPAPNSPAADVYVKTSINDTTTGYLSQKIINGLYTSKTIVTPSGNEKVKLDVVPSSLISSNIGNILDLGTDGKFRVLLSDVPSESVYFTNGVGINITGTGLSASDPYVISTNASIQVVRSCFDGIWRNIPIIPTANTNVVFVSGTPKYRIRFDGTIEFKGSATYTVQFGNYSTGNRKQNITFGTLPITCLTLTEQTGILDLKSINYIDVPQTSADQIVQQYGYIIRKSNNDVLIEFQSSFSNITYKTIVVNFDSATSHPNL